MKKKLTIGIILTLILVIFISAFWIMNNLIVDETPIVSDVIIVPEGSLDGDRPLKASSLLEEGYSRSGKVIVSPLNELNVDLYRVAGVPQSAIINEPHATSTYENAVYTLAMMDELDYQSAIVVSSDYHMLRTRLIYERENKDYNFDLTYVAAYHPVGDELVKWYDEKAPADVKNAASKEYFKTIGYFFYMYHFINLEEN